MQLRQCVWLRWSECHLRQVETLPALLLFKIPFETVLSSTAGYTIQQSYSWCQILTPAFVGLLDGGTPLASTVYSQTEGTTLFQVVGQFTGETGYREQFYCQMTECLLTPGLRHSSFALSHPQGCYC